MKNVLAVLCAITAFTDVARAQASRRTKVYRDETRGIQFRYPSQWSLGGCPFPTGLGVPPERARPDPNCVAVYRRRADAGGDRYVVTVTFADSSFEDASKTAGFMKRVDRWFMSDRFSEQEAEDLSGPGWKGIRVVNACGIENDSGYHAAGGEELTAVLSSGDRSAVVRSACEATPPGFEVTAIIKSVKFGRTPAGHKAP